MTKAVVEIDKATFCRKQRTILSDVSWQIDSGQHWALLGANGSGKTTLLKILTGYEWPTFGSVKVLGERFGKCDIRRLRRLIGWVSSAMTQRLPMQDKTIDVVASGLDASIGLYRQITQDERDKALAVLQRLCAGSMAGQRYGTLSQGEMQKVLIARALVCRPRLLILDEPCIGLDPAARQRFLCDLSAMAQSPDAPTLVLVTHHIEEIGPWIRRVLLLKEGRVLTQGSPDTTLTGERMSELFGAACRVERNGRSYSLRMPCQC